jgi:hypothetical protein
MAMAGIANRACTCMSEADNGMKEHVIGSVQLLLILP